MFQLAQVNIARAHAPLTDPVMADFVGALDRINARAEESPGFVWRHMDASGSTLETQAYEDPLIIVNLSVWETVDALMKFAYGSEHVAFLRRRADWFARLGRPHMAMWWIPAGHRPSVDEARERLDHLEVYGESPIAFTFRRALPRPSEPVRADVEVLTRGHGDGALADPDLDGRAFVPQRRNAAGDATPETKFVYRRHGAAIWATCSGGGVHHGMLAAREDRGMLLMRYLHAATGGVVKVGTCVSRTEALPNGKLRLHEHWQWDGQPDTHWSVLDEV